MIVLYINVIILCLLVITAIAINQQDNLFATTMLTGIFSLLSASLFVCLDAVDVAFTEAAVGAGEGAAGTAGGPVAAAVGAGEVAAGRPVAAAVGRGIRDTRNAVST